MKALEFLFPAHTCLGCRAELNSAKFICGACEKLVVKNDEVVNLMDKDAMQYFSMGFAPFKYGDVLYSALMGLKYNGVGESATWLAPYMADSIKGLPRDAVLVPVPLHKKRTKERGYNQAQLLSKEISKITGHNIDQDILKRVRHTVPQKRMSPLERAQNSRGAFTVLNIEKIKNKYIIVIDDVFTSGSTVNECARMLMINGARRVFVLTCSKV